MTDQAATAETKHASLSEILNGDKPSEDLKTESVVQTKAEATPETPEPTKEAPKTDAELEKIKQRLADTQKWGNSQRQATLKIIKNLQEKGISEEEIAESIGGQDVFTAVMRGLPVEQELNDPMAVVNQAFNQQVNAAASVMKEMGHTDDELKEIMSAFNSIAYDDPEHRDEMYRRATSGEGSVAAYALKVGKEKLEEYRTSLLIKTKGPKAYEQELREKIMKELAEKQEEETASAREELVKSGKPRLVSGQPTTPLKETSGANYSSMKDIFGR